MEYKHKEIGWFFLGVMGLSVLIFVVMYSLNMNVELPVLLSVGAVIITLTLLFYQLTVSINDDRIQLTYGIGIIRITKDIQQIESVEITRTPWYYGLGIRLSPLGLIYNIQSLKAVKIEHSNNGKTKTFFIGTPEPEAVKKAIEKHLFLKIV